ncbi:hypothetical protein B0I35DRAFT_485321 [Stachybotrys elegans]|uniref:Uncharacterized protein n=1 Tax=Stachybotrys elegans TaxID=80388 RepID=A0A8K0S8A0_9HYPO|nr:hypothetical protein B0I35DRAFT_485321 [Stachybotrys elegans]
MSDVPELYASKAEITRLLTEVPFVWNRAVFVAGEPRSFYIAARKSGDSICVVAINGVTTHISPLNNSQGPDWKPAVVVARNVTVDITYLVSDSSRLQPELVITDIANSQDCLVLKGEDRQRVMDGSRINIEMVPFGGVCG